MTAGPRPRDPGLQPERTALAWLRTGIALMANVLLAMRAGITSGHVSTIVIGVLLVLAALLVIGYGVVRKVHLTHGEVRPVSPLALIGTISVAGMAGLAGLLPLFMGAP